MNDAHDNAVTDKNALARFTPKPDDWKIATTYAQAQAGRYSIVTWADQRTVIAKLTGPDAGTHAAAIVRDHNSHAALTATAEKLAAYQDAENYATRFYPSAQQRYHDHAANGKPKTKRELAAMLDEAVGAAREALAAARQGE